MDQNETNKWQGFMKASRGLWTIDPVHNGVGRDLIAFRSYPDDETAGVYVQVIGATASAGTYEGAIPHIGEALFNQRWTKTFDSSDDALARVIERLGVDFLLEALQPR